MLVQQVMVKKFPKVYADEPIDTVIKTLVKVPESALPVVDRRGKFLGEISQHELLLLDVGAAEFESEEIDLRKIKSLFTKSKKYVKDFMNVHDLSVGPRDTVLKVAKIMYDEDLSMLPVVDMRGRVVGIITDIAILKKYKAIRER